MGWAGTAECCEHVELPCLQSVPEECFFAHQTHVFIETRDAAEDFHRGRVDLGSFPLPFGNNPIDFVHEFRLAVKNLDVEILTPKGCQVGLLRHPRLVCRQGPPDFESGLAT